MTDCNDNKVTNALTDVTPHPCPRPDPRSAQAPLPLTNIVQYFQPHITYSAIQTWVEGVI